MKLRQTFRRRASARPRLVLYPGFGKTGTTALQTFLRCLPQGGRNDRLYYAEDPLVGDPIGIGSGNGVQLIAAMQQQSESALHASLDALLAPEGTSVISSEAFGFCDPSEWKTLASALTLQPHDVRVVVAIRDLYPFAWSAYQQWVKRHGFYESFETCITREPIDHHITALQNLVRGFGGHTIRILRYEDMRKELITRLLAAGDVTLNRVDVQAFERRSADNPQNRSLTFPELRVARTINETFGDRYSTWVSDVLVESEPSSELQLPVDTHLVGLLERRFSTRLDEAQRLSDALNSPRMEVLDATRYSTTTLSVATPNADEIEEVLSRLRGRTAPSEEFAAFLLGLRASSLASMEP